MPGMVDPLSSSLEHYLGLLSQRQKLTASNIANADTPGYKTRDIDFAAEFKKALDGGAAPAKPAAVEVDGLTVKNDGNNVSLERESRILGENAMRFTVASSLLRSRIQEMRRAIHEGESR
jgi:flagellar basal-body rod protein FlgB